MYMLKTFTIKQIDAFRTAGLSNIKEGGELYLAGRAEGNQSKQEKGVRLAAKGTKDLVQIATLFAAANAGTDVIKDVIYGRPINADETLENSLLQVIGINRYHIYNAKRKGPFKAGLDYLLRQLHSLTVLSMTYLPSLGTVSTRAQCYKARLWT